MAMQVYDYEGRPFLIENENDFPEKCTTIKPPEGIWEPFYFDEDNQKWIGSEPIKNEDVDKPVEKPVPTPSTSDKSMMLFMAQSNMTIAKQAKLIKELEEQKDVLNKLLAKSYLEIAKTNNKEKTEVVNEESVE